MTSVLCYPFQFEEACIAGVPGLATRPFGHINALRFDDGQIAKLSRGDYSKTYDGGTLSCDPGGSLYALTAEWVQGVAEPGWNIGS